MAKDYYTSFNNYLTEDDISLRDGSGNTIVNYGVIQALLAVGGTLSTTVDDISTLTYYNSGGTAPSFFDEVFKGCLVYDGTSLGICTDKITNTNGDVEVSVRTIQTDVQGSGGGGYTGPIVTSVNGMMGDVTITASQINVQNGQSIEQILNNLLSTYQTKLTGTSGYIVLYGPNAGTTGQVAIATVIGSGTSNQIPTVQAVINYISNTLTNLPGIVHIAGEETITGRKIFNAEPVLGTNVGKSGKAVETATTLFATEAQVATYFSLPEKTGINNAAIMLKTLDKIYNSLGTEMIDLSDNTKITINKPVTVSGDVYKAPQSVNNKFVTVGDLNTTLASRLTDYMELVPSAVENHIATYTTTGQVKDGGTISAAISTAFSTGSVNIDNTYITPPSGTPQHTADVIADLYEDKMDKVWLATQGNVAVYNNLGQVIDGGTPASLVQNVLNSSTTTIDGDNIQVTGSGGTQESLVDALNDKMDKVPTATEDNLATYDANGQVKDGGTAASIVQNVLNSTTTTIDGDNIQVTNSSGSQESLVDVLEDKMDKVPTATEDNVATYDNAGQVKDGGSISTLVQNAINSSTTTINGDNIQVTTGALGTTEDLIDVLNDIDANKMDKVPTAVQDHIATYNNAGQVIDGGTAASIVQNVLNSSTTFIDGNNLQVTQGGSQVDLKDALDAKMNLVPTATAGNLAIYDNAGQVIDPGKNFGDIANDISVTIVTNPSTLPPTTITNTLTDVIQDLYDDTVTIGGAGLSGKQDLVDGVGIHPAPVNPANLAGNIAVFDANGQVVDSGEKTHQPLGNWRGAVDTENDMPATVPTSWFVGDWLTIRHDSVNSPSNGATVYRVYNNSGVKEFVFELSYDQDVSGKMDKVGSATNGQVAIFQGTTGQVGAGDLTTLVSNIVNNTTNPVSVDNSTVTVNGTPESVKDAIQDLYDDKMDKVPSAVENHIATYNAAGQVKDGGDLATVINTVISSGGTGGNTVIQGDNIQVGTGAGGSNQDLIDALTNLSTDKMDKVPTATQGHVATYNSAGQVVDGGDLTSVINTIISTTGTGGNTGIDGDGIQVSTGSGGTSENLIDALNDKMDKVPSAVENHLATYNTAGQVKDGGTIADAVQTVINSSTNPIDGDNIQVSTGTAGASEDLIDALNDKMDKVPAAVQGHIATYNNAGQVIDGGTAAAMVQDVLNSSTTTINGDNIQVSTGASGTEEDLIDVLDGLQSNKMDKVPTALPARLAKYNSAGQVVDGGTTVTYNVTTPFPDTVLVTNPRWDYVLTASNTWPTTEFGQMEPSTGDIFMFKHNTFGRGIAAIINKDTVSHTLQCVTLSGGVASNGPTIGTGAEGNVPVFDANGDLVDGGELGIRYKNLTNATDLDAIKQDIPPASHGHIYYGTVGTSSWTSPHPQGTGFYMVDYVDPDIWHVTLIGDGTGNVYTYKGTVAEPNPANWSWKLNSKTAQFLEIPATIDVMDNTTLDEFRAPMNAAFGNDGIGTAITVGGIGGTTIGGWTDPIANEAKAESPNFIRISRIKPAGTDRSWYIYQKSISTGNEYWCYLTDTELQNLENLPAGTWHKNESSVSLANIFQNRISPEDPAGTSGNTAYAGKPMAFGPALGSNPVPAEIYDGTNAGTVSGNALVTKSALSNISSSGRLIGVFDNLTIATPSTATVVPTNMTLWANSYTANTNGNGAIQSDLKEKDFIIVRKDENNGDNSSIYVCQTIDTSVTPNVINWMFYTTFASSSSGGGGFGQLRGVYDEETDIPTTVSSFNQIEVEDFVLVKKDTAHDNYRTLYQATAVGTTTITWTYMFTFSVVEDKYNLVGTGGITITEDDTAKTVTIDGSGISSSIDLSGKMDKVTATAGHLATFDSAGQVIDGGAIPTKGVNMFEVSSGDDLGPNPFDMTTFNASDLSRLTGTTGSTTPAVNDLVYDYKGRSGVIISTSPLKVMTLTKKNLSIIGQHLRNATDLSAIYDRYFATGAPEYGVTPLTFGGLVGDSSWVGTNHPTGKGGHFIIDGNNNVSFFEYETGTIYMTYNNGTGDPGAWDWTIAGGASGGGSTFGTYLYNGTLNTTIASGGYPPFSDLSVLSGKPVADIDVGDYLMDSTGTVAVVITVNTSTSVVQYATITKSGSGASVHWIQSSTIDFPVSIGQTDTIPIGTVFTPASPAPVVGSLLYDHNGLAAIVTVKGTATYTVLTVSDNRLPNVWRCLEELKDTGIVETYLYFSGNADLMTNILSAAKPKPGDYLIGTSGQNFGLVIEYDESTDDCKYITVKGDKGIVAVYNTSSTLSTTVGASTSNVLITTAWNENRFGSDPGVDMANYVKVGNLVIDAAGTIGVINSFNKTNLQAVTKTLSTSGGGTVDISGKMDKVPTAPAGALAVFNSAGQVVQKTRLFTFDNHDLKNEADVLDILSKYYGYTNSNEPISPIIFYGTVGNSSWTGDNHPVDNGKQGFFFFNGNDNSVIYFESETGKIYMPLDPGLNSGSTNPSDWHWVVNQAGVGSYIEQITQITSIGYTTSASAALTISNANPEKLVFFPL